ncbi:hypothetical protein K432DRAFT_386563 [Lepidopterella palustris CBS 459.81]|uniref:Uncharacterized protein n=1 Tax=Lepidopterella palustris CBS 459.81 TaxID=1314670 RepID=A0A8E2J9Y0_9PEZI|nr:hypothetical protein K432DRAFT_386563 [Lepidopterella palustris CBS 459.81]
MQLTYFLQSHLALSLLPILQRHPTRDSSSSRSFTAVAHPLLRSQRSRRSTQTSAWRISTLVPNLLKPYSCTSWSVAYNMGQFGAVSGTTSEPWINTTHPGAVKTK